MTLSVFVLPVEQIKTFYKNYMIYPHCLSGRQGICFFSCRLGKWSLQTRCSAGELALPECRCCGCGGPRL